MLGEAARPGKSHRDIHIIVVSSTRSISPAALAVFGVSMSVKGANLVADFLILFLLYQSRSARMMNRFSLDPLEETPLSCRVELYL